MDFVFVCVCVCRCLCYNMCTVKISSSFDRRPTKYNRLTFELKTFAVHRYIGL